ncbi:TIGR04551 family protein [Myxococcota bacterium]|nr:TIGR04551 family protein [Myxococcota bacterium]
MALPTAGHAQTSPRLGSSSTTAAGRSDVDRLKAALKEELREELKEELKAEIKAELEQSGATQAAPKQDAWAEDEWKWEEPVKPELNFLELDGYFRFRYQMFNNLDLGTYYYDAATRQESGPFINGFAPPTPTCNTDPACKSALGETDTLGGANLRLRLEPTLNVYEDIKIKMQWDILDNLVLGSTPEGYPATSVVPLLAFSRSQTTPSDGINALSDSIEIKRVWAEVGTPLGQLRVGRMPSHFGLGVLANEGRGLDADYGNSADRIMFITKIGDFYIAPAFDWVVSGPTSATRLLPTGQPFDRDQRDDVDQYVLAIAKRDKDEEIRQKLENDELVLNYGTYQVLRFQALDAANYFKENDPESQAGSQQLVNRDAQAWIYSFWAKLLWRKLSLEAELAGIYGKIGNSVVAGGFESVDQEIDLNQMGGVLNAEYKLLRDSLTLSLLVAVASGDSANGWGITPLSDAAPQAGSWDGSQAADGKITNFRFDPGFYVDLVFWRQIVGVITDAMIVKPGIQYNLTEGFGARLDLVYSRAWFSESTPSASLSNPDANLGLEGDVKIFFDSEDGFHAWLQYGMFVPFAGLDRSPVAGVTLDAGIAHSLQALVAVSF